MRRCRVAVGELRGELFLKLLEMLIDSGMLHGQKLWIVGGKSLKVGRSTGID